MKDVEAELIRMETMLEEQVEVNQKMLNFLIAKNLLGDFREWEQRSRGMLFFDIDLM